LRHARVHARAPMVLRCGGAARFARDAHFTRKRCAALAVRGQSRYRLWLGRVAHCGNVGTIWNVATAAVGCFPAGLLAGDFVRGLLRHHRSHPATVLLGKDRARRKGTPSAQSPQEVVRVFSGVILIEVNAPDEKPNQIC
jgi:hypothetical protein